MSIKTSMSRKNTSQNMSVVMDDNTSFFGGDKRKDRDNLKKLDAEVKRLD